MDLKRDQNLDVFTTYQTTLHTLNIINQEAINYITEHIQTEISFVEVPTTLAFFANPLVHQYIGGMILNTKPWQKTQQQKNLDCNI